MNTVSVVLPVYNNADSLRILLNQLINIESKLKEVMLEVIFVDDGSRDRSWLLIEELSKEKSIKIVGVSLSRNYGQLAAIKAGLQISTGECVICISADLQDPMQLVEEMIVKWQDGYQIVICHRISRQDSLLNRLTSRLGYILLRQEVSEIPKGGFDVFLLSRLACNQVNLLNGRHNFLQGDVLSLGFDRAILDYDRLERPFGKSGYNFHKRLKNFSDALLDSSLLPIKIFTTSGFLMAFIGLILAGIILVAKLRNETPFDGFFLLATSVLLIGGFQLLFLGIVSQYVWRIYDMSRNRPDFIIKNKITSEM